MHPAIRIVLAAHRDEMSATIAKYLQLVLDAAKAPAGPSRDVYADAVPLASRSLLALVDGLVMAGRRSGVDVSGLVEEYENEVRFAPSLRMARMMDPGPERAKELQGKYASVPKAMTAEQCAAQFAIAFATAVAGTSRAAGGLN